MTLPTLNPPLKRVESTQPSSLASMDLYHDLHTPATASPQTEKQYYNTYSHIHFHPELNHQDHHHGQCHNARLRRLLLPLAAFVLAILALGAISCLMHMSGGGSEFLSGLAKRAVDDGNNESPFTRDRLYIIVIVVGIVVCIILAIMLSAWCCRGAFQNPLCCPCYLCACCGGLACLECIGCGLCAEGLGEAGGY